jgi:hypothetical protein
MKNTLAISLFAATSLFLGGCASDKDAPRTTPTRPPGATGGGTRMGAPSGGSEETRTDIGSGGDVTVYVSNASSVDICYLYLNDVSGFKELLGENYLPSGFYGTITGVVSGFVEVYAEACDGEGVWYASGEVAAGSEVSTEFNDDNILPPPP